VERIESESVVLGGTDDAIDDPGEYGLYWDDGYGWLGDVTAVTAAGVVRPFVSCGSPPPLAPIELDLDGWYYPRDPGDAGLAFDDVTYTSPVGELSAWYVPAAAAPASTWAVHVHGWGADRREAIRTLATYRAAGIDSLVVTARNDPGAPPDPSGRYRFGRSEWEDVDGAVRYALAHGAERVILVGYSTGAASEMAFLERSVLAGAAAGLVFDAPNLDLGAVVKERARDTALIPGLPLTVPNSLTAVAMIIADLRYDIGWRDIDSVDQPVDVPVLVFHGDEDDTVPLSVVEDFAGAHPAEVRLIVTAGAGHVLSWNVDRDRYERELGEFLSRW
jgi:uncharacterized protein